MERKIIAVVGSTGAQGGGLVDAILSDPGSGFAVRAITRKPTGEKAQALAKRGAEVVAADLDDEASLRAAFKGAHGAFCVTNYWELFSVEKEMAQAKNLADAARAAGVKHVVWSTLEDTRQWVPLDDPRMPTLHEKYKVPHFDGKGASDRYFTDGGPPTTLLRTTFYWENMLYFGMGPKRGEDGVLSFSLPMADKKLAGIAVADIGRCALGIFKRGGELIGKTVGIMGEALTGDAMAAQMSQALGEKVVYRYVPPEVYRTLGFPGADDLGNMFQFYRDFEEHFCTSRDVTFARSLHPGLLNFSQWLERNKAHFQLG